MREEPAELSGMLLHTDPIAPNVRRVSMFLAEKGLEIPTRSHDASSGELREEPFRSLNPLGQVPVLEAGDGLVLSESMAICRYLDDRFPEPPLFGRSTDERARIHMWSRRAEWQLFHPAVELGHHAHPLFRAQLDQIPAYADQCRQRIDGGLEIFDAQLQSHPFLAGDRFSVADVVAYCGLVLARLWRVEPAKHLIALARWEQETAARPSAAVARY